MLEHVTDVNGSRYTIGRKIGAGGQGAVYELKEGKLAVKLLHGRGDPEILRRRIERVRRLDLRDIPLARPITTLRPPHSGYVMDLVSKAHALQSLIIPPPNTASVAEWYLRTGGLRGRLRVLSRLARALAILHGRGLAYGDLAPSNVVFAGDLLDEFTFHLLDCDNIRSESLTGAPSIFTLGYGAPELVTGTGSVNTLSDLHSFAIVAFECLCGVHPFVGDAVAEGEPDLEEKAFAGELPWIEDPAGGNLATRGIPRELTLSERIRLLFGQAFGVGRRDPGARPRAVEWAETFEQAADMTLSCPRCRGSYYLQKSTPKCAWCGENPPKHMAARFALWDPAHPVDASGHRFVQLPETKRPRVVAALMLTAGVPHQIERRHLFPDCADGSYAPIASVVFHPSQKTCEVKNLSSEPIQIARYGQEIKKREIPPRGNLKVAVASAQEGACYLHFGASETLHRALNLGSG